MMSLSPACRYCHECKRYLDRIYDQARNQSQMSWWKAARNDERQVRDMLAQYRAMLGDQPGVKRMKVNVAELKETVTRQQRQSAVNHGRLMWMREAIEFCRADDCWQSALARGRGGLSMLCCQSDRDCNASIVAKILPTVAPALCCQSGRA